VAVCGGTRSRVISTPRKSHLGADFDGPKAVTLSDVVAGRFLFAVRVDPSGPIPYGMQKSAVNTGELDAHGMVRITGRTYTPVGWADVDHDYFLTNVAKQHWRGGRGGVGWGRWGWGGAVFLCGTSVF